MTVCPANCFSGFAIMSTKITIFAGQISEEMKKDKKDADEFLEDQKELSNDYEEQHQ